MEEINANLLYLCIPKAWNNIYYKLLYLLADEGKNIIDDCNYTCSNHGNNVFTCWNLFQSAIAANEVGENKKANLFINYIDKQLDCYIKGKDIIIPTIDTELLVLSQNKKLFEKNKINIICSDYEFIEKCRDKRLLNKFFIEKNINKPH